MANEYLKRTPTSTGNRKVFTWSGWVKTTKESKSGNGNDIFFCASSNDTGSTVYHRTRIGKYVQTDHDFGFNHYDGANDNYASGADFRDFSSWSHYLCSVDTTKEQTADRVKIYVNGVCISDLEAVVAIVRNIDTFVNGLTVHYVGADGWTASPDNMAKLSMSDVFFVDGQALTPDAFGFYKDGKGYISAGTTQATDFRPGQWVPHTPRRIKSEINRRGGFGVNGFYLPMNSSNNFGADFHCEPDTILKLKSSLPQPKAEIDGVGDYTGALRDDPFKQYLVLAVPGVIGGKNGGYGDYSADIKGSGTNKTLTANGNATVSSTSSYYGSALVSDASGGFAFASSDFAFGTDDFTFECWFYISSDTSAIRTIFDTRTTDNSSAGVFLGINSDDNLYTYAWPSGTGVNNILTPVINQWHHVALERNGSVGTVYLNGVAVDVVNMGNTNYTQSGGTLMRPALAFGTSYAFPGYVQDARVYKGVAKYKGGFDVPKPYTPVDIATWRAVPDTTANNFATLNPLYTYSSSNTYTNGNLKAVATANDQATTGNMAFSSGKWYWETRIYNDEMIGLGIPSQNIGQYPGQSANAFSYHRSGSVYYNGSISYGAGWSYNTYHVIGIAVDWTNKRAYWHVDGVWANSADPSAGTGFYDITTNASNVAASVDAIPAWRTRAASTSEQVSVNFGQNPTFSGKIGNNVRINSSNTSWDQTPNTGSHNDWTISNDGRDLNVSVSAGYYARAYLYLDPNEKYLLSFDYISGPANLGVVSDTSGYLKATDGSLSPNGLSAGNSYTFEISNSNSVNFTGFNSQTYDINNIYLTRIVPGYQDSNGKGEFRYEPPAGFLALCEDNLPAPAIADPGEHFKTVIYEGTATSKSIKKVGFQPDLVWVKKRSTLGDHKLVDSVRGTGFVLESNTTDVEGNETINFTGFNSDGFDLGNNGAGAWNENSHDYVAWCWKAGGAAVSNTDGSITTQVSANQTAGFSIVSYTGNNTAGATIGHGLGETPGFIIVKRRDSGSQWNVWTKSLTNNQALYLNLTNSVQSSTTFWNDTTPTSSVITLGTDRNVSNGTYIAYCWTEIEGFSKFGSYVGNGSTDGTFVYCGFKPAFVMIKRTDSTGNWVILDSSRNSTNPAKGYLLANSSGIEQAGSDILDFLSNGFKIRNAWTDINGSGNTIIFAAFAESPFQTANAK